MLIVFGSGNGGGALGCFLGPFLRSRPIPAVVNGDAGVVGAAQVVPIHGPRCVFFEAG